MHIAPNLPFAPQTDPRTTLRTKAAELETSFLSEMLSHAGFDSTTQAMGGGQDAAQFSSFLRDAEAKAMVRAGGIGLTEALFQAMAGNGHA